VAKASAAQKPKQLSFADKLGGKPGKKAKGKAEIVKAKAAGAKKPHKKVSKKADKKATKSKVASAPAPELEAEVEIAAEPADKKKKARAGMTAERMGELQREISISEFFTKNRHLLGFDNASRALLTSVKEAVDNSLDAAEEGSILPDIQVRIEELAETRFRMVVEDNGPGIVKAQVPKVFGKLLYGSKFHRLRQSRGQQGIGISAAGMYGQLTTGKPVRVVSKTGKGRPAYHCELTIDTKQNKPVVSNDGEESSPHWEAKDHGTSVSIEMEAVYKGGKRSLDEWVQQVAFANPHARIEYYAPGKQPTVYPRLTLELPPETKEIKPHPYGIELGIMMRMIQGSASRNISGFLQTEFSRVSQPVAAEICKNGGVDPDTSLKDITQQQIEQVFKGIAQTKIMSPPTNCLAPIGETSMLEGLKALLVQQHIAAEEARERRKLEETQIKQDAQALQKAEEKVQKALETVAAITVEADDEEEKEADEREVDTEAAKKIEAKLKAAKEAQSEEGAPPGEEGVKAGVIDVFGHPCFLTAVTRSPRVYRGNPFQVEAAIAYGGELPADDLATVIRFANRVPLMFQPGACAMTQSVVRTTWKTYDVEQARGALPTGPLLIMVHIASVWVPFTSEAKEAVAHYDEIIAELKFALQECGRRLSRHIRRKRRILDEAKKAKYIEKYIPHIGEALQQILGLTDPKRDLVVDKLTGILERSRSMG
jgi:DNA topoisomerase VI subunit B